MGLPSLTETALQPETARRRVEADPQTLGGRLIHIPGLLVAKQRALRTLIRQLEPDRPAAPRLAPSLTARLEELGDPVEVQWGLPVVIEPGRPR